MARPRERLLDGGDPPREVAGAPAREWTSPGSTARSSPNTLASRPEISPPGPAANRGDRRSYAVRVSDPPLSLQEPRGPRCGVGPAGGEYSDAVVASSLERVDQEIAARVSARRTGMGQPESSAGPDHRRNLLKGVSVGVAVSGIAIMAIGSNPDEQLPGLLWVLLALVLVCAVGADWAGRQLGGRALVRTGPRVGQG